MNFVVPVVFIIYNRPEKTKRVFEIIRKLRPTQLFIIADGPKNDNDKILCDDARKIISLIDWETNLNIDFSLTNMGNAQRTISGLDNVFKTVEEAIILEDDCVPNDSFFEFCKELLDKYRHDEDVMHISGCNLMSNTTINEDYFFSKYILPPWGWATWKRAWRKFNPKMDSWQKTKKIIYSTISQQNFKLWTDTFEYLRLNKVTWDIPWNVDIWANNGIGIIPSVNMICNIGFDEQATFTKKTSNYANLPTHAIKFPLTHPENKMLHFDKQLEDACVTLLKEVSI